jgi:MFS family permease
MAEPTADLPGDVGDGFTAVLRHRDFRLIYAAQVAAQLADKFLMFSLIILAYKVSGGSTQVAVTLLAYTVPAVVIAPVAGVFADRHDRKQIMVATNTLRGLLVATIPIASYFPFLAGDYYHLLVITFLISASGQFFSPAEAATIPTVLPKKALLTANSMVLLTTVGSLVVGGALAPVLSRYDIYAPYWWGAALFIGAALLILAANIPQTLERVPEASRNPFRQLLVELKEGMDALRHSEGLLLSFGFFSIAVLVMFVMFTLAPAYVSTVIKIQPRDSYEILLPATFGAGKRIS